MRLTWKIASNPEVKFTTCSDHLQRSLGEERINDYNPLLLYLWKANLNIQYVADSSLALAHYVTAYVTKAEKSHMQELWEDISEQESLYKKLWRDH